MVFLSLYRGVNTFYRNSNANVVQAVKVIIKQIKRFIWRELIVTAWYMIYNFMNDVEAFNRSSEINVIKILDQGHPFVYFSQ